MAFHIYEIPRTVYFTSDLPALLAGAISSGCIPGQHLKSISVGAGLNGGHLTVHLSEPDEEGVMHAEAAADTDAVRHTLQNKVRADLGDQVRHGVIRGEADTLVVCEESSANPQQALVDAKTASREAWRDALCPNRQDTGEDGKVKFAPDPSCRFVGPVFFSERTVGNAGNHSAISCVGSSARIWTPSKSERELTYDADQQARSHEVKSTESRDDAKKSRALCEEVLAEVLNACAYVMREETSTDPRNRCRDIANVGFLWDKGERCLSQTAEAYSKIDEWTQRRR